MNILGIHDGHNASAAVVNNGKVLAAIQEERLTREKNQGGCPLHAIKEVLSITGLEMSDIDTVAVCGQRTSNLRSQQDILSSYAKMLQNKNKDSFWRRPGKLLRTSKQQQKRKMQKIEQQQLKRLNRLGEAGVEAHKTNFIDHHLCHSATAYYGQNNRSDKILVLTCDGAGDSLCATVSIGENNELYRLAEIPHTASVAVIYSLITYLMGFIPIEHEYKLMGMAPYAANSHRSKAIAEHLLSYFRFDDSFVPGWKTTEKTSNTFTLGAELQKFMHCKRFDEICGGLQLFAEQFVIKWIKRVISHTGVNKLALSGGLFMNVKLNKQIMDLPEVESLFIFPSCSDESNSIGAAWFAQSQENPNDTIGPIEEFYLGGEPGEQAIHKEVANFAFNKKVRINHCTDIEKRCAELIARGEIVARCKGRMEFGARALGNRSILASPNNWESVRTINEMIKKRDFWMPFAPSITAEETQNYILNPKDIPAPYMILAFDTRREKRDKIIAATHPYDETCRPQMVIKDWNPDYARLIGCVKELTGEAVVLNTSFNLHGFPIVYRPVEALQVFDQSGLKYLALGDLMIEEIED